MPSKSHRDVKQSGDFFRHPETGSNNGVERPTTTEAEEWEVEALRAAHDTPSASTEEEWDLDALRLTQDFEAEVGGKKLLTTVPVRKPSPQEFIRVHPDRNWHLEAALLEVLEERENYLVIAKLQHVLAKEVQPVDLVTAVNRSGLIFLWPVKRHKSGKRDNNWIISAQEGARFAQRYWVKVQSDQAKAAYDIIQAAAKYPDSEWPVDHTFSDLLKLAFKDRVIRDLHHPVLRRLRGEI